MKLSNRGNGVASLAVKGVSKRFGGLVALDHASVELDSGRITGLIGPNGAGKTTLYNVMTGFLPADGGDVIYKGERVTNLAPVQLVHRGICRSFQDLRLFLRLSVLDNVMAAISHQQGERLLSAIFGGRGQERQNRERAMMVLDKVGLAERASDLAEDLGLGEQKVLCLARVLATDADVMLLDEPTANLDYHEMKRMFDLINGLAAQGKTICIVEHNVELIVNLCHYVYALHLGRNSAEGTPQEIVKNPKVLSVYLGERGEGVPEWG